MISREEYQERRQKLAQSLPAGAVALLGSADELLRNGDAHYSFRQNSSFYYLTGFEEPNALLVVLAGKAGESYLFNNPRDKAMEQWTGQRLGQEAASAELGVKGAYSIEELTDRLPDFLANRPAIFYALGQKKLDSIVFEALQSLKKQIRQGISVPQCLQDLDPILAEMRLIKSEAEIACMKRAAAISVEAHKRAMRAAKHARFEYELEAELLYEMVREGCRDTAYGSIVAFGKNACTLHYTANRAPLSPDALILIDAGGEFENYAADITRTFPVQGRFSGPQKQIYELVLQAQKAGIACIKPGVPFSMIQEIMVEILTQGLIKLKILSGKLEDLIKNHAYKAYYPHSSGHWLGLDVHDAGAYKKDGKPRLLEAGMVLTVEPGLYLSADIPGLAPCWHDIGVRIEDDILVTESGHENLTKALAVEVQELEAFLCE